jgi:hypothetical protein
MKPNKPAQPPQLPETKTRFRVRKLEERIAPKGRVFSRGCHGPF